MSSSLIQLISDMTIEEPKEPKPATTATPPPPMYLPIPTIKSPGRKVFFAFDVSFEWLVQYAETHWNMFYPMDHTRCCHAEKMNATIKFLKAFTRISELTLEWGVPNENSIHNKTAIPGPPSRGCEPFTLLVSVCSSRRSSFNRRPTQAQFDRLVEIMGRQPEWWIDYAY